MSDDLEERKVAALEKQAEAALLMAQTDASRLELEKANQEDMHTLRMGVHEIFSMTAGYIRQVTETERAIGARYNRELTSGGG